jgi:hypothetical protein
MFIYKSKNGLSIIVLSIIVLYCDSILRGACTL